jgi:Na+-transporting methylmalonyl-CoA/oxaloacetate decarboxylase gamma subunit
MMFWFSLGLCFFDLAAALVVKAMGLDIRLSVIFLLAGAASYIGAVANKAIKRE